MGRPKLMSKSQPEQVCWTPIQAAKKLNTSTSHLKVIEKELDFDIDKVPYSSFCEIRKYSRKDMEIIGLVIQAKNLGIPLSTIKMYGIDRLPEIVEFFTKLSQSK